MKRTRSTYPRASPLLVCCGRGRSRGPPIWDAALPPVIRYAPSRGKETFAVRTETFAILLYPLGTNVALLTFISGIAWANFKE